MVAFPACVFHPCYRRSSSFHIQFFHTGASFFTRSLYPNFFCSFTVCVVGFCFTVIVYFLVSTCISYSEHWWCLFSFVIFIGKTVGVFFNVVT